MDRAYEDDQTRALAEEQGFIPVVPPKKNRREPWNYDKELYKRRNEVERFFLRLKRFRKVFTRYDKLDIKLRADLPERSLLVYSDRLLLQVRLCSGKTRFWERHIHVAL